MCRRALSKYEQLVGSDHIFTTKCIGNLALTLHYRGQLAESEIMSRRVLVAREEALGDHHVDTLQSISNLAVCFESREGTKRQRVWTDEH